MANDISSISSSAINAYQNMLQNTASNVANLNTEGYKPRETQMQDLAGGGVVAKTTRDENAYSVDLSKEMVTLITADIGVKANAKVLKTAQDTQKSIVDILI